MEIKQLYKAIFSKRVRECIASMPMVQAWRNSQLIAEGKSLAIGHKKKWPGKGPIRVVLLETRRGFWPNHASIYEAMSADGAFDVQVFAVPKRTPAGDMDWNEYQHLMDFFDKEGIPCLHAYDCDKEEWNNPISFGLPDVVFLSQPYDFQLNFMYGSSYWSRFSQVAFLNYGFTVADAAFILNAPCLERCHYIFCESEFHRQLYLSHDSKKADKLIVTGHPSLDAYLQPLTEKQRIPYKSKKTMCRIIWAPHFTVAKGKTEHCFSHFFEHFDVFVHLAEEHPELEIVMRPHPELFKFMIDCGMKSEKDAAEYRKRFEVLPNAFIYEGSDYLSLFRQSDAMVLDSIGFIGMYAPTGKPICFLESAKRARLNSIGERLLHVDYAAWNAEEIREFVERVVLGGDDWKKAEREAAVKKLIYIPPEGAGARIAREIKTRLHAERKKGAPHGQQ